MNEVGQMATDTVEIECLECEKDFETTSLKVDGETFKCTNCGHEHCAAYDDEQEVWYAAHLPVPHLKFEM